MRILLSFIAAPWAFRAPILVHAIAQKDDAETLGEGAGGQRLRRVGVQAIEGCDEKGSLKDQSTNERLVLPPAKPGIDE